MIEKIILNFYEICKGQAYVELAYMTGILPIAKYSSGSEINMFKEYGMTVSEMYSECFGFLESEVDTLFHTCHQTTKNQGYQDRI